MGLELAKAWVSVRGDTSKVAGDLRGSIPGIRNAFGGIQSMMRRMMAIAGIGIGMAVVKARAEESIALAEVQIDAEQRVAAVIRATGGAAGFSAEQLKAMASEFQNVTTFGDEAILQMQAKLLTFKTITGDTFKLATETILDMAAVLGTDASSAAIQMGRALEDPIRGVTALRRTGVSFSDEQKAQIKLLVESNKLQEAQALILQVVRDQLGGVAKAMAETDAGKLKQAKNVLGDMKEEIGKKLLPLKAKMTEMWGSFYGAIAKGMPYIQAAFTLIGDLAKSVFGIIMDGFGIAFGFVQGLLSPWVSSWGDAFKQVIGFLDVMLGSWEGLRAGIIYLTAQAGLAFQAIWEQAKNYLSVKLLEMKGAFIDMWYALGQTGVVTFTPFIAKMLMRVNELSAKLKGEKYLVSPEEEAAIISSEQGRMLGELAGKRMQNERATRASLEQLEKGHQDRMREIGIRSLQAMDAWSRASIGLPTLSGRFKKALEAAMGQKTLYLGTPTVPGPAAAVASGNAFGMAAVEALGKIKGRIGFEDFGRKIQDAFLEKQDPQKEILTENKKQTGHLGKIETKISQWPNAPPQPGLAAP